MTNLNIMNEIQNRGANFHSMYGVVAEIFDSPFAKETEDGEEISDWEEMFRRGEYGELFVPNSETLTFEFMDNGEQGEVSSLEFLAWQLANHNSYFLYYLINKTDTSTVARELYDHLDNEDPQEWNGKELPEYWVTDAEESWLNEYDQESIEQGIEFIDRCKQEKKEEFGFYMANAVLAEYEGLLNTSWYEADLSEDFDTRDNYDDWDVQLMCVADGKFFPYVDSGMTNVSMDDFKVHGYHVRNYDED